MRPLPVHIKCLFIFVFLLNVSACFGVPPKTKLSAGLQSLSIKFQPGAVSLDSTSCVIPFTRAGNLILIQATVDTMVGNFILDTGAPYLVLNITYFRDYQRTSSDAQQTSISGS